jgi:hypothetical protein
MLQIHLGCLWRLGNRIILLAIMNIAGIIPLEQKAAYLRTLPAIRERCQRVFELAKEGKLEFFDYHPEKEEDVVAFCVEIMKVGTTVAQLVVQTADLAF